MSKIPSKWIEELPNMETDELWKTFKMCKPDKKTEEKVLMGIEIKFSIYRYLNGDIESFPHANQIRIAGIGEFNYDAFNMEMEERENLMREYILESFEGDIAEGRVQ